MTQEEEEAEYEERGIAGIRLSSAVSSDGGFEESAEKDRPGGSTALAEFVGWGGAGGAGWGPWSHVDMQLVVGQASKHRVSADDTSEKAGFLEKTIHWTDAFCVCFGRRILDEACMHRR